MKKCLSLICALTLLLVTLSAGQSQQARRNAQPALRVLRQPKPKLVVVIVLDQLRADYLTRFAPWFSEGGFKWLMRQGANLANTHYSHATTYTAPGHAQILSGSFAHISGVVGNRWYNYQSGKAESIFHDPESALIGAEATTDDDTSPRNFIGSNVSDQLLLSNNLKSKAIGLSLKARSAMMLAGKLGKAYWFHNDKGAFLSSTYYMKDLPDWVRTFNARKVPDGYLNRQWEKLLPAAAYEISTKDDGLAERDLKGLGTTFPHKLVDKSGRPSPDFYEAFTATPFATDYELEFARTAIEQENLGVDEYADLLGISISTTDIAGHAYGPYSQEAQDLIVRTDRQLADFFAYLNRRFKSGEVVIALSADHGVAPIPEYLRSLGMEAGRIPKKQVSDAVDQALDAQFGEANWVVAIEDPSIYLNRTVIAEKKLDHSAVERVAADAVLKVKGIAGYFTRTQMLNGQLPPNHLARAFEKAFYPERSGDVFVVIKPFYFWGSSGDRGTTHGSPYEYDSHVPMIIVGSSVRPGVYNFSVDVADLAPTLSAILDIAAPSGNEGRVLHEILMPVE